MPVSHGLGQDEPRLARPRDVRGDGPDLLPPHGPRRRAGLVRLRLVRRCEPTQERVQPPARARPALIDRDRPQGPTRQLRPAPGHSGSSQRQHGDRRKARRSRQMAVRPGAPSQLSTGAARLARRATLEVLSRLKPGDSCLHCGGGLDASGTPDDCPPGSRDERVAHPVQVQDVAGGVVVGVAGPAAAGVLAHEQGLGSRSGAGRERRHIR